MLLQTNEQSIPWVVKYVIPKKISILNQREPDSPITTSTDAIDAKPISFLSYLVSFYLLARYYYGNSIVHLSFSKHPA
jgi:uncharacterized membrane protein